MEALKAIVGIVAILLLTLATFRVHPRIIIPTVRRWCVDIGRFFAELWQWLVTGNDNA